MRLDNLVFEVKRFEEPEVQFDGGSAVAPKRGLYKYGPRLENDEHHTITAGVIGDRVAVRRLNDLLVKMKTPIHPDDDDDKIRPWRVPFPGTGPRSKLDVSISMRDRWTRRIRDAMLDGLETYDTPKEKMDYFLDRVQSEVELLSSDDPRPDIIIVCIPEKVIDECTPENQEYAQPSADGSDLHDRVKILGMEHSIPTQLIKPSTLDISNDRQRASRAWNLTVGMLYKAQEGHPWKTKELEEGACYAGISFYKDRSKDGKRRSSGFGPCFRQKGLHDFAE